MQCTTRYSWVQHTEKSCNLIQMTNHCSLNVSIIQMLQWIYIHFDISAPFKYPFLFIFLIFKQVGWILGLVYTSSIRYTLAYNMNRYTPQMMQEYQYQEKVSNIKIEMISQHMLFLAEVKGQVGKHGDNSSYSNMSKSF